MTSQSPSPKQWRERRKLYGPSLISSKDLELMVRHALRSSGELTFDDLRVILYGATDYELSTALHSLVRCNWAQTTDNQRYVFLKDSISYRKDHMEELTVVRQFREKLRLPFTPSSAEEPVHEDCRQKNELDCNSDPPISDREDHMKVVCQFTEALRLTSSPSSTEEPLNEERQKKNELDCSNRRHSASDDRRTLLAQPDPQPKCNDPTAKATGNRAAPGGLRCTSMAEYLKRTSVPSHRPAQGCSFPSVSSRFCWRRIAADLVQKDPVGAVERYCRLQGLAPPGYSVVFMPREKIHYCVLQVANRAFRSYPTQARTHQRAIEVTAEKAVAELGLTQDMLAELERRQNTAAVAASATDAASSTAPNSTAAGPSGKAEAGPPPPNRE